MNQIHTYTDQQLKIWIEDQSQAESLAVRADEIRRSIYGTDVYLRGLIEFTNYCKNNCYYCGIRCGNSQVDRYRLSRDQIMDCCEEGYRLGYRTIVLQGGEDPYYKDEDICRIVSDIKKRYPDCAVTLSIGEKSRASYQAYFDAGADRFLLREETSNEGHYRKLHPEGMSMTRRQECLFALKEIGFQVGAGFMVDSPYQTTEDIIADLRFLEKLQPDMIGIGPYVTHSDTSFAAYPSGSVDKTLRLISILRIMFPYVLLPATTALGTMDPLGREKGLKAGANVIMPNLSPTDVRKKYALYDNKICTGEESAQCRDCLELRVKNAGDRSVTSRGDVKRV